MIYSIFPIGDGALLLSFGNLIDRDVNRHAIAVATHFMQHPFVGLTDIVPAYSSVTFCYDPVLIHNSVHSNTIIFEWVKTYIEEQINRPGGIGGGEFHDEAAIEIPVCYHPSLINDLESISSVKGLSTDAIIELHSSITYHVYMLGFLPGFAYMGTIDGSIEMPRKPKPTKVKAGSVAIAGQQTGVYPLNSFGGWNVVGHTPQKMFDASKPEPCYLKGGQKVKFSPISLTDYHKLVNKP